jgi:hypothetical protein
MPKFLLAVHHDYDAPVDPDAMQDAFRDVAAFNEKLEVDGALVFAGGLLPPSEARTVRPKGDGVVTTDGPYAESKEVLGGFWVVEAPDRDAAVELATQASLACRGPVEVRPFEADS